MNKQRLAPLKLLFEEATAAAFRAALAALDGAASRWPRDEEFRRAWMIEPVHSRLGEFWLMATGRANPAISARLRRSQLAYCRRDTWAMVRIHKALEALAARSS
jgi:hypothetical protein